VILKDLQKWEKCLEKEFLILPKIIFVWTISKHVLTLEL